MSRYRARPMREQDIEGIIALDARITGASGPDRAGFWRGLLSLHTPQEMDEEEGRGARTPPAPHLCHIVESLNGEGRGTLAGFIIGDVQSWQFGIPRHGRIVAIGVHPDHRRDRIGSQLVDALLATFRKMSLPFVHCLARPGDPLSDFFRSAGFSGSGFETLEKRLEK